jgi:hypothetical protein
MARYHCPTCLDALRESTGNVWCCYNPDCNFSLTDDPEACALISPLERDLRAREEFASCGCTIRGGNAIPCSDHMPRCSHCGHVLLFGIEPASYRCENVWCSSNQPHPYPLCAVCEQPMWEEEPGIYGCPVCRAPDAKFTSPEERIAEALEALRRIIEDEGKMLRALLPQIPKAYGPAHFLDMMETFEQGEPPEPFDKLWREMREYVKACADALEVRGG